MLFRRKNLAFTTWTVLLGLLVLNRMASGSSISGNFSCYQCATTSLDEKCGPETLKPCQQTADRCVTHITKSPSTSLMVKRECGLGPCSFEKVNSEATAVLGMDHCDVTKADVFCVLCCRESGCNSGNSINPYSLLIATFSLFVLALAVLR